MPALDTLEYEYEHFSLDEANESPMSLDDAVRKAQELRKTDPSHFYRVESTNGAATAFRVTKVAASTVYAEFVSRMAKSLGRHWGRHQSR